MLRPKERASAPLSGLTVEDLVPADHFYRRLESMLDLSFARDLVADRYAAIGRPAIEPVVFFKLQLVMFFEGIRSERQLLRMAADRLSVRWYLGCDLGEALPDHSSLTKIRQRYGLASFRRLFEAIVERCRAAGLVWGKELYFDATQVDASASLDSSQPRFAVEAHLRELFPDGEVDQLDREGEDSGPPELPLAIPDAAREELTRANVGRHDWFARDGRPDRTISRGAYRRRSDFEASPVDPDAALMARKGGGLHFGYHDHYAVDGGRARIILGVLVTPADVMENQPFLDLLWRVRFRWQLRPMRRSRTSGRSRMPAAGPTRRSRTGTARPATARPASATTRTGTSTAARRGSPSRADAATCNACPVKAACTASAHGRTIQRSFHAEYLDRVRTYHETAAYRQAMRKRSVWVEPLFGEAKDWHGLKRFRLRTLWKVNSEALLVATGQNLKRLLRTRGWGRRPWPNGAPEAPQPHRAPPSSSRPCPSLA
jgi:transposase